MLAKLFMDQLGISEGDIKGFVEQARDFMAGQDELLERTRHLHLLMVQAVQRGDPQVTEHAQEFERINNEYLGE